MRPHHDSSKAIQRAIWFFVHSNALFSTLLSLRWPCFVRRQSYCVRYAQYWSSTFGLCLARTVWHHLLARERSVLIVCIKTHATNTKNRKKKIRIETYVCERLWRWTNAENVDKFDWKFPISLAARTVIVRVNILPRSAATNKRTWNAT